MLRTSALLLALLVASSAAAEPLGNSTCNAGAGTLSQDIYTTYLADTSRNGFSASMTATQQAMICSQVWAFVQFMAAIPVTSGTPIAIPNVGNTNAAGSATTYALSDHAHQCTAATATQVGCVSTGAQTWAGTKTIGSGASGASATATEVLNSGDVTPQFMKFFNNNTSTNLNPLVAAGDNSLLYSNGTIGTGGFFLGPWSASSFGLRMDAAGRVGLNRSPAKWNLELADAVLGDTEIQLGTTYPLYLRSSWPSIGFNWYYDGSERYGASNFAAKMVLDNAGTFHLYVEPTGIAGNVITQTEAWNVNQSLQTSFDAAVFLQSIAFASLPALGTNGALVFCNNCTITNPCAAAGTGAIAKRLNGAWVCN